MLCLNETIQNQIRGDVVIGLRNAKTNTFTPLIQKKNLIMFGAADIMAHLLGGDSRYAVSHMYYQYQNISGSVTASASFTRADGITDFLSIDGSDQTDWLRIPIITAGKVDSYPVDSTQYSGNAVTFVATSASSSTQTGESASENYFADSGDDGPSKVYAIALAAALSPADKTKDIVFSRLELDTPITVEAGNYIDCFWQIAFR